MTEGNRGRRWDPAHAKGGRLKPRTGSYRGGHGPYPDHVLKRVDRPTTLINDEAVARVDERHGGFYRAKMGEYGLVLAREYQRFVSKHPLSGALDSMTGTLGALVEPPENLIDASSTPWGASSWSPMPEVAKRTAPGTDDPAAMSAHVKATAYFLRADIVGVCELPRYAVFTNSKADGSEVRLDHKYAIAIVIDQDWPTVHASTGNDWISNSMSFVAYAHSGFVACVLADYIRRLGYEARAHHAMNYQVVVPPILLWAGLGEMCRIGDVVLNPFLGPRFKAAVVTTDLPLMPDGPIDFGLQDFCSRCKKCARECPSRAISHGDKIMFNGYEKWPNDVRKCTSMRVGNQHGAGCGKCIKVCPWNKPFTPFHRAMGSAMRNLAPVRRFAVWGDDLLGYGKERSEDKWWLDLEEEDGELVLPAR
jgi:3-chloro-4-hydroxyphenylacetate reductive dehalogenase